LWLFAFNIANCIFWFCTWCMTSRGFANWVTNCRAMWVITLPGTLWMAFRLSHELCCVYKHVQSQYNWNNQYSLHLIKI
jgi:hypothetical protein